MVSFRYKKGVFMLASVLISSLLLYNEVTQQYNINYEMMRQRRSLVHSLESKEYGLQSSSFYAILNNDDVIKSRSLSQTNESIDETLGSDHVTYNYTSLTGDNFDRWLSYNKGDLLMFTFTAVATNFSFDKKYNQSVVMNGWEGVKARRAAIPIKCCFKWNNNRKTFYIAPNKTYPLEKTNKGLTSIQVYCPHKGSVRDVSGVTLEYKHKKCPTGSENYVKPSTATKQKNDSFAICGKIFYNKVDIKLIIDWVEYYREMKVDKILIYTYNLKKKAKAVIQYYAQTGFVETGKFDFPLKNSSSDISGDNSRDNSVDNSTVRDVGTKNDAAWQDEQVVVFDCYERLKGYTYFTIVDLDEFILPRKHPDLKSMMGASLKNNPHAAGFSLKSHLFIKNWGKVEQNTGSDIVQYFNRSSPILTRQKNIVLPERVKQGTIHTHTFRPRPGYTSVVMNQKIAVINHYRKCYDNFLSRCTQLKQYTDKTILKFVNRYKNRSTEVLNRFR